MLPPIEEETKQSDSYMSPTSLVLFITIAVAATMYKFDVFSMGKVTHLLSDRLKNNLSDLDSANEKDIFTLALAAFGITTIFMSVRVFLGSEKQLKLVLEFVWGIFVYSIVATGVYFTYGFTAN